MCIDLPCPQAEIRSSENACALKIIHLFTTAGYIITIKIKYKTFWSTTKKSITKYQRNPPFYPNLRLNESFMVLAGALLAFNIIHRFFILPITSHVVLSTKKKFLTEQLS